ncbi:Testis-expressed protein 11 [Mactra antiquata]
MASKVLDKTEKAIEKLQKNVLDKKIQRGESDSLDQQKLENEKDMFTLLCYKAEMNIALSKIAEALENMMMAKELLSKFPQEGVFLSMLCYNAGVELYQNKQYKQAIVWLRESYEISKHGHSVGPKNQARTLRLLANVYLEDNSHENLQNALNAVSLANTENRHPAGLFLKLKILLLQNVPDTVIKPACEDLLNLKELTVDLSLHALQVMSENKRMELVTWFIEGLLKKFEHTKDIGKLLITNTEVLLQSGMIGQVKQFIEYFITAHHTGHPLEISVKKRFHVIFWEQAASAYEAEDFEEALQWYNYSLSLYTQSDSGDQNLAKLHRNRANCYMSVKDNGKAKEAIEDSLKCDPLCAHSQFILFKLALIEDNNKKACEALKKLCELAVSDNVSETGDNLSLCGLVALTAQQALEMDKTEAACIALEHLSITSSDVDQVITALRCLIRIKLTVSSGSSFGEKNGIDEIIKYVRTGYNKLLQLQDLDTSKKQYVQNEADWFIKIAWNLALQCDENPYQMKDLYCLCSQLLLLTVQDDSSQSRQMTCILMASAACLQYARQTNEQNEKKCALEECIDHVTSCREMCDKMREFSIGAYELRCKQTDTLLILYEFEARMHLNDPGVEKVIERAITMSGLDPKTFEILAAVALEPPSHNKNISVRLLKIAIRKHLQNQQPDILKCSKLFHSLVQLCLGNGSAQDIIGQQEAWNYYTEIFDLIGKAPKGEYPEMEIVWLMTKAWNCGIQYFSGNKYTEAEKWCGLSMRMLKYLDAFKNNYEDHMSTVYTDILVKLETPKDRLSLEN